MEKPSKKVDLEFLRSLAGVMPAGRRADIRLSITDAELDALPLGYMPDTMNDLAAETVIVKGCYLARSRALRVDGVDFFLVVWRETGAPVVERAPEPPPAPKSVEEFIEASAQLGRERGQRRLGEMLRTLNILQGAKVATWEALADAGRAAAGIPMEELAQQLGIDLALPAVEWRERVRCALESGRVTGVQAAQAVVARIRTAAGEHAADLAERREMAAAATLPADLVSRLGGLVSLYQPKAEA